MVRIEAADADAARLVVRQARRLGRSLAGLDADQWSAITRCDGWTVRDVIAHLVTTNQFWAFSLSSAFAAPPGLEQLDGRTGHDGRALGRGAVEAFSIRRPFPADVPAEAQSLLHGLATVFDQA